MAHILVVEDEPPIADLVELYLERDGHDVTTVSDGLNALSIVDREAPDLILLDLMLPGLDGRGVCRRIRERSNVPIIMLTALDDSRDKIRGLELGADDYVTKPFDPAELAARVRAVLRRFERTDNAPQVVDAMAIVVGNLTLYPSQYRIEIGDVGINLRAKEFELLELLASNPNIAITRNQLLEKVWGETYDADSRTLDVHISRLRDRLRSSGASFTIETVRNIGYRLTLTLTSR